MKYLMLHLIYLLMNQLLILDLNYKWVKSYNIHWAQLISYVDNY